MKVKPRVHEDLEGFIKAAKTVAAKNFSRSSSVNCEFFFIDISETEKQVSKEKK